MQITNKLKNQDNNKFKENINSRVFERLLEKDKDKSSNKSGRKSRFHNKSIENIIQTSNFQNLNRNIIPIIPKLDPSSINQIRNFPSTQIVLPSPTSIPPSTSKLKLYSLFVHKILSKFSDPYLNKKYSFFSKSQMNKLKLKNPEQATKELNFYKRMDLDVSFREKQKLIVKLRKTRKHREKEESCIKQVCQEINSILENAELIETI